MQIRGVVAQRAAGGDAHIHLVEGLPLLSLDDLGARSAGSGRQKKWPWLFCPCAPVDTASLSVELPLVV